MGGAGIRDGDAWDTANDSSRGGSSNRRLKVLVSAYACEPGQGSEPGVGWRLALELAQRHDVWVLTRANNQPVIEAALAGRARPTPQFLYYDLPRWASWWKSGGRGVQVYYYLWQLGSRAVAARAHRRIAFDVVHHLTFGRYWSPSGVARLGPPFVWGPLGGGETTPMPFRPGLGPRGGRYEALRDGARAVGERDPLVRRTAAAATITIASTRDTAERLRSIGCRDVRLLLQMGVDPAEADALREAPAATPAGNGTPGHGDAGVRTPTDAERDTSIGFATLGRLIPWKGVHLAVEAFARADAPGSTLTVIGDGPQLPDLRTLAARLGVADRVAFLGNLPRQEALRRLRGADVLVHPSLHDQAPAAIFEALALGKPVVALDIGGPGQQVGREVGFVVPARDPEQAVTDMAQAMTRLARDAELRNALAARAPGYVVERFAWSRKAEQLSALYLDAAARVAGAQVAPTPERSPA